MTPQYISQTTIVCSRCAIRTSLVTDVITSLRHYVYEALEFFRGVLLERAMTASGATLAVIARIH